MSIGVGQDVVTLKLGGTTVLVAEHYEIKMSLTTQPHSFALRLGHGGVITDFIKRFPPNTQFELAIDGKPQFRGRTDGYTTSNTGGGTEFTVRGRCRLAPLHDAFIRSETSFPDITFADLVKKGLDATLGPNAWTLVYSNDANRKAITGDPGQSNSVGTVNEDLIQNLGKANITVDDSNFTKSQLKAIKSALTSSSLLASQSDAKLTATIISQIDGALIGAAASASDTSSQRRIQAKIGERWYDRIIKPELDRAGLFLWSAGEGTDDDPVFVLSIPRSKQTAKYRIFRRRGTANNAVTVKEATYKNETTGRYSEAAIHFARGGGTEARLRGFGFYQDQEMIALGYDRPFAQKHHKAKTIEQADFLARKVIVDARRAGWQLIYKVAGHTTPGLHGGRLVWAFDTIVDVDDDEFDIHGPMYIADVTHQRGPETSTTLTLMRPDDVLYGDPTDDGNAP